MDKLQELKKKYKELGEEIERLENQGKVWTPKVSEKYWCIIPSGYVDFDTWANNCLDIDRYQIGNCFKTKEEAEKVVEKMEIYTELKRLAEEINTEPIEWVKPEQRKYYISYDREGKLEGTWLTNLRGATEIYSTNKDFLKIAKERIGEEKLLKLFRE
ncbi:MAG: hypothetical protein IJX99_01105 [Clostridia bacterium]|nr:hypothetical protein [Clostridia bacterium]MBQ8298469.1 hypothetical protein [Clostridia bacterium]